LAKIGELDVLQRLYGEITTTPEVAAEYGEPLPSWVQIHSAKDKYRQQLLEMQLDKGESSAIALALEMPGSTVILDDYKARKTAARLGLPITGTIGIIVKAKLKSVIPSVKPLLAKIRHTNFRLSAELEAQALQAAQE
jgi:predicted nucleic acid-binding protein